MGEKGGTILERLVNATFVAVKEIAQKKEFDNVYNVDTNVLIDVADPMEGSVLGSDLLEVLAGLQSSKKNNRPNIIVVTQITRDELNGLKKDKQVGPRARQALENLANIFSGNKPVMRDGFQVGVEFPNGSLLVISPTCAGKYEVLAENNSSDHQQVAISLAWKRELAGSKKSLSHKIMTMDYDLSTTARQFGIIPEKPRVSTVDVGTLPLGYVQIKAITDARIIDALMAGRRVDWRELKPYIVDGGQVRNNTFLRTHIVGKKVFLRVKGGQVSMPNAYDTELGQRKESRFLSAVRPTELQRIAYDLLLDQDVRVMSLVGPGSAGKTSAALAAGLHQVVTARTYDSLFVTRPFSSEDTLRAFMPGQEREVLRLWMRSVYGHLEKILKEGELERLMEEKLLQFEPIQYFIEYEMHRGFVIVRDAQNLSKADVNAIGKHMRDTSKLVLVGDLRNVSNPDVKSYSSGLAFNVANLYGKSLFGHVTFSGQSGQKSKVAKLFG